MPLAPLLRRPDATFDDVRALLDGLDHEARVAATRECGLADLSRLWELSVQGDPIDAAHFVGDKGPLQPVAHDGWNSLPLPAFARRFQKVFCRPAEAADSRLFGFNEGDAKGVIGPGYFQLVPTLGNTAWEARGAWVVDYYQVPDAPVPEGWPKVVPNWWGLQLFVYNGTRDFMRRVSSHVCIGKPWAREMELPFCFVLVRRD